MCEYCDFSKSYRGVGINCADTKDTLAPDIHLVKIKEGYSTARYYNDIEYIVSYGKDEIYLEVHGEYPANFKIDYCPMCGVYLM